jgi:hypothetical protein
VFKPENANEVIKKDNADHHQVTDAATIVPNDLKDAYTKANAEPKERPDKADPVMEPPDSLLTHESKIL